MCRTREFSFFGGGFVHRDHGFTVFNHKKSSPHFTLHHNGLAVGVGLLLQRLDQLQSVGRGKLRKEFVVREIIIGVCRFQRCGCRVGQG